LQIYPNFSTDKVYVPDIGRVGSNIEASVVIVYHWPWLVYIYMCRLCYKPDTSWYLYL